jgi:hypothetical protein
MICDWGTRKIERPNVLSAGSAENEIPIKKEAGDFILKMRGLEWVKKREAIH